MKPTIAVVAAIAAFGAVACAEVEAPAPETAEATIRYSEAAEVVADDGRAFIVEVGFDDTIAPEVVTDLLGTITIVAVDGIRPVDEGPVFDGFAPDQDGTFVQNVIPGLDIVLTPVDSSAFFGEDPWYMVENIDPREIARAYEDACPAWH